jgi:hypothetical protein
VNPPLKGVVLWAPTEVQKLDDDLPTDNGWWVCSALATNIPGDRLLIYATRTDQGIVAVCDVASSSFKHPALSHAVYGRPKAIPRIAAAQLPASMRGHQRHYQLTDSQRKAIADLLPVIPWQDCDDELPAPDDPRWDVRLQERYWGSENGLSDVIAANPDSYAQLGYSHRNPPRREEHPAVGSKRRMDLFGTDQYGWDLVTELKHFCGVDALAQLDGYMEARRALGRRCAGNLVALTGYSRDAALRINNRKDVALWRCWPNDADHPVFEHIAGPRMPEPR